MCDAWFNDMLNLFLLCIGNHNQDKEHTDVAYGMDGHLVYVQMIEE
jgi:hypothetical protein